MINQWGWFVFYIINTEGGSMEFPKVAIIILNWNGWKDTIECLESLYQINYPSYDVIVVDNGSKDNSTLKLKEFCEGKIKVDSEFFEYNPNNKPIYVIEYTREQVEKIDRDFKKEKYFLKLPSNKKLRLILNERNYGFVEGNNIAIRYALKVLNPDYILLLNNDTVVDPNFLTELIRVAEDDEKIGVVGPKIYYYDFNGRKDIIWFAGGVSDVKNGKFYHFMIGRPNTKDTRIKEVDFITGCCMLIKKTVFGRIGLLDIIYFAYCEDIDFSLRAKRDGFKIVYVPIAVIWHKVSATGKGAFSPKKAYYKYRNTIILTKKHGKLGFRNLANISIDAILYIYGCLKTNKKDFFFTILEILKAFGDGIRWKV